MMWETKPRTSPQNLSWMATRLEQAMRPKTLQAIWWQWCILFLFITILLVFVLLFSPIIWFTNMHTATLLTAFFHSASMYKLWGGADKSLARPTSWCRRTESIVSLERGVCSCAELQVFSCYRCMSGNTHDFNNIEAWAVIKFFSLQDMAPKKIHAILIETLGEHAPLYVTIKNWVA